MLVLRPQNVRALQSIGFTNAVREYLLARFPDLDTRLAPCELTALMEAGLQKTAAYGITDGWDITRYMECQLRWGARFDEDADYRWAAAVLAGDLSGTDKMDRIDDHVVNVLRQPL